VTVEADLTLPGHPEILALGDMVRVRGRDGAPITLPGVAPVAMQQGRYAAKAVRARLQGRTPPPFRYRDKGNLATIGRAAAVADIKGVKIGGFPAWMTWLVVHLFYLVGFQNRLLVVIRWSISFATRGRGARLITDPADAEAPAAQAAGSETNPRLAMTGGVVFVELDTRQDAGYTISLEWDRDTGQTQIVVADIRDASLLVFPVPGANAGDAFRDPFRYAP
jgi:hypothetical protein